MMDNVVTLKKKTERSLVEFARYSNDFYKDKTVAYCLEHKPLHLIWIYYHVQWITFTDDILDKLRIFPEQRIDKPGIAPDRYEARIRRSIRKKYGDKAGFVIKARERRMKKKELEYQEGREVLSKLTLQALNHGHGMNINNK